MPPRRRHQGTPDEWLSRARSSLAHARGEAPGVCFEDLSFDAQQAAEKAIKGLLVKRGLSFPYVHDLEKLLSLLEASGVTVPDQVRDAGKLSAFAFESRYPSPGTPVTRQEYLEAVALAEAVVRWAEARLAE